MHCKFETGERLAKDIIGVLEVFDDVGNAVTVVVKNNLVEIYKTSFGKDVGKIFAVHVNEQVR